MTAGMIGASLAAGIRANAQAGNGQAPTTGTAQNASFPNLLPLPMTHTGSDQIPQKPLGRTGVHVSIIGMGGHHLGDAPSVDVATQLVHQAVDAGITFFDNCWEYHRGKTEDWLGAGLKWESAIAFSS